ncbi:MAG: MBL fold metallo-hydrolase [Advenella sp.]
MSRITPLLFSGALAITSVFASPAYAQATTAATTVATTTTLAATTATPTAATTSTKPAAYTRQADSYSMPLGNLTISALSDGTVPQDLYQLLIGASHSHIDNLLDQSFLANPVEASINAFLIRDGKRNILVDTGSGELFGPGYGGKLYDSLASVGLKPEQITDILVTHIHTDHTGGLVQKGKPAFPNATVYVGAPDLAFFLDAGNAEKTGYDDKYFAEAIKTIGVYDKLGKVKTFDDEQTILPGIKATIHPGHTPGSAFFTVSSQGQSMVFVGDIVHVESVQFPEPDIAIVYDLKPEDAISVRKNAFSDFAGKRQLIAAPHLPFPGMGHVRAESKTHFSWHPVEYRNRTSN